MGAEILVETVADGGLAAPVAPPRPAEDDYRALYDALSSNERGREFLAEFARRNRHSDTEMVLAALERLETQMRADGNALERLRDEMRMLLIAIRLVRPEINAASPPAQAEKLSGLLDMLERHLDAMTERKSGDIPPTAEEPAPAAAMLTVVPVSDEPELPMPAPSAAPLPPISLVRNPEKWEPVFGQDHAQEKMRPAVAMPEVTFVGAVLQEPTAIEFVVEKAVAEKTAAPAAIAALPPVDPLAAILALSEFEKIALFT